MGSLTNGGATWTERTGAGRRSWYSIASSGDGQSLAVGGSNSYIYTSTDGGAAWIERTGAGQRSWSSIASSGDGQSLAAGADDGLYRSLNGGATWERIATGSFDSLITTWNGAVVMGRRFLSYGRCLLYSSALNTFDGLSGQGTLKLIYMGQGVFGYL